MPRLSPDARSVLSGVGSSRIKVNGVIPPGLEALAAGGWAWKSKDIIVGNGSESGHDGDWHSWEYHIPTATLHRVNERPCSAMYGGGGHWIAYLASNPLLSFDDQGREWPLVARSMSPFGQPLLTSHENDRLYWEGQQYPGSFDSIQAGSDDVVLWCGGDGKFQTLGEDSTPLAPSSGGLGARFTGRDGEWWLCQWNAGLTALVLYKWTEDGPLKGYVLSTDEHDFNHDIGTRDDGMLIIATGIDAGETSCRVYECDLMLMRFRVNGGDWKGLDLVPMGGAVYPVDPPTSPIITFPDYRVPAVASYGRPGYCGPFKATDLRSGDFESPGNCEIIVDGTVDRGNQRVDRPFFVSLQSTQCTVDKTLGFFAPFANVDTPENAGIVGVAEWYKRHNRVAEKLRYFDGPIIQQPFIDACEPDAIIVTQCVPLDGETRSQSLDRFAANVQHIQRARRRSAVDRAFNIKYGGVSADPLDVRLARVLTVQEGICDIVRGTHSLGDFWFSWGRWAVVDGLLIDAGAAYIAELQAWANALGKLFTRLP